jgi:hypothetical protein
MSGLSFPFDVEVLILIQPAFAKTKKQTRNRKKKVLSPS